MANYYAHARTNYFGIKPELLEEFKQHMQRLQVKIVGSPPEHLALISDDESGWPSYDPELEDKTGDGSTNFDQQIARYLVPGQVAIMMETGHEANRYVAGSAVAVDSSGASVYVNLTDEIMQRAERKWPKAAITEPSY